MAIWLCRKVHACAGSPLVWVAKACAALSLVLNYRCSPYWWRADIYEQERGGSLEFQPLPFRYLEVAHVLLTNAKECFSAKEYIEARRPGPSCGKP